MDAIVGAGGWCAPSGTIYDRTCGPSREDALWAGLVEPTQEERQAAADALYEQEVQDNRNWFATGVFLGRVEAHEFDDVSKAILDVHAREERHNFCTHCDDERVVMWPCHTARIVLKFAGIDIPDEVIYDKPKLVLQDNDNPRWPFPAGPVDTRLTIPLVSVPRGGITFDMGAQP